MLQGLGRRFGRIAPDQRFHLLRRRLYICSGGWPSRSGVSVKPFLGQPAARKINFFRVCDRSRRESDLLMENLVFVDIPYAMLQFGGDVLEPEVAAR